MTASEAFRALKHGADGVKLFSASVLGCAGWSAMLAVRPRGTNADAFGGASRENFSEWMAAGKTGCGIDTGIYRPSDTVEEVAVKARNIVASFDRAVKEIKTG